MNETITTIDKNHILDLTIKTQSMIVQGHLFSAGQFVEEIRHILENEKTYIGHK